MISLLHHDITLKNITMIEYTNEINYFTLNSILEKYS